MKKLIAILFLAFLSIGNASAAQYCKCDTGAAPGCTATVPDTPTVTDITNANADRTFAFGNGCVWRFGGALFNGIRNLNASRANPVIFTNYATAWSGSSTCETTGATALAGGISNRVRTGCPTFIQTSATTLDEAVFHFGYFSDAVTDGGYVIQNLVLEGIDNRSGTTFGAGIKMRRGIRDVLIRNVEIRKFAIAIFGVKEGGSNYNVQVRDSYLHRQNYLAAIDGQFSGLLLENNVFEGNGLAGGFNHNVYLGSANGLTDGQLVIRSNLFLNGGNGANGAAACEGGNLTIHGRFDVIHIIGNRIEATGTTTGNCYGISLTAAYAEVENLARAVIEGNTCINISVCIPISSAPGVIVRNNTGIDARATSSMLFIAIPGLAEIEGGAGDADDTGAQVYGNAAYWANPTASSRCVVFANDSGTHNAGTDLVADNNLCIFNGASGTGLVLGMSAASFDSIRNNYVYGGAFASGGCTTPAGCVTAGYGSGNVHNATVSAANLAATPDATNKQIAPSATSPFVGGAYAAGLSDLDGRFCVRPGKRGTAGTPAVGALDYFASTCTPVPSAPVPYFPVP